MLRRAVTLGRLSFRQALSDITTSLGNPADDLTLRHLCEERARAKAEALTLIEHQVLAMLDCLRSRGIRIGIVSNCFAEDVVAWPHSSLASRSDCTVFSFEVGLAKPDPEIYREATRRLQVDASRAWFIGDGHEELSGAVQAGLRPFRAVWFLRQWPHFREDLASIANIATIATVGEIVSLVEREIGPIDNARSGP
jgi:putative hydrolase of the HAD superfamily